MGAPVGAASQSRRRRAAVRAPEGALSSARPGNLTTRPGCLDTARHSNHSACQHAVQPAVASAGARNPRREPTARWSVAEVEALLRPAVQRSARRAPTRRIARTTRPMRCSSRRCCRSRPGAARRIAPTVRRRRAMTPASTRGAAAARRGRRRRRPPPRRPAPRASAWARPGAARGDATSSRCSPWCARSRRWVWKPAPRSACSSPSRPRQLSEAGLDYYNHNLDTAPEFYGEIITTRTYQDRLDTLARVRDAGINVCCGGIVGMGESRARARRPDRAARQPRSVSRSRCRSTIWCRSKARRCYGTEPIDPFEFVRTIAVARITMPRAHGAAVRGPAASSARHAGAVLLRRRELDLLRRQAADHGQSRCRRRTERCCERLGLTAQDASAARALDYARVAHEARALSRRCARPPACGRRRRSCSRVAPGAGAAGRRPRTAALRRQRLPGPGCRPARGRRGAGRRGALRRRRRRLASGLRALCGARARWSANWRSGSPPCADARALLFSAGYMANLAIVTALCRPRRRGVRRSPQPRLSERRGAAVAGAVHPLSAPRSRGAGRRLAAEPRAAASSSAPMRCSAWTATWRRCRSCWSWPSGTMRGWWSTTRTASACSAQRPRRARALRARLASHRVYGHAGQGRRRRRRVRRRACGPSSNAAANRAQLCLHHRLAAAARLRLAGEPRAHPRRAAAARAPAGAHRALARRRGGAAVAAYALGNGDSTAAGRRQRRGPRAKRRPLAARAVGAGHPAADRAPGHGALAHHA